MHINILYNWIPKITIPPFSQSCIILRTTHFSGQVKHNFNPLGNLTSSQRFCCLSSSEGSSITASVMVSCKAWINLNPRESKWIRPQQSPTILTYRHLISGHILLIKEVNTLHFLTSDGVIDGCGEEGNGTTGLMGIPAQGHRHKGVLLQANRSEGALRQVRQALQGPGNWCYKKAMGISQLCCFSYHSKHLVVNFQLTIASLWFFQERSWCQPPRFHHFIGYKGNWNF